MARHRSFCLSLATLTILVASCPLLGDTPAFERDAAPIFAAHCTQCHGQDQKKNGLDLRTRAGALKGGKSGPAVVPGSLRDSLLWNFIATDKMPANDKKLSDEQKDALRRWILAGAHDGESAAAATADGPGTAAVRIQKRDIDSVARLIDESIDAQLAKASVRASAVCDDATFLRRVYLDLTGRAPTYQETVAFLDDPSSGKRARLIDERLASAEFGEHFAIIWHKLLIPKSAGAYGRIPHERFRAWLAEGFNQGRGWDKIVTDLVTAEGYLPSNKDNEQTRKKDAKLQPLNVATSFIDVHNTEGRPQPKAIVTSVSRLFMAQSLECAQCHNHPLAKWRKSDFWAAAAFFERVRFEKATFDDVQIGRLMEPTSGKDLEYKDEKAARYAFVPGVYDEPVIDMENADGKRTGRMIRAAFLDGVTPSMDQNQSHRAVFAGWMTSPENPFFAKTMVNRLWGQLLGRGFVEPVDDMSEDNPPSHPRLLAELAAEFAGSEYDLRHLIRCICNSQTYQRGSEPTGSELNPALFSHQSLKQLSEEQLLATLRVTLPTFAAELERDAQDRNPGLFTRYFRETFETGEGPLTDYTRGLQQALRMMNGDGKLFNREAIVPPATESEAPEKVIERIYLQVLNRRPRADELTRMTAFVRQAEKDIRSDADGKRPAPQRKPGHPDNSPDPYADVLWVLVNSGEFMFNH